MRLRGAERPLLVMHTTTDSKDHGNPYSLMLMASMPADIRAVGFRWERAIFGRYDVIHVHWPELLLRDGERFRSAVKKILFSAMFLRLIITRTPIVQTVHNIAPHERGSGYERRVLRELARRTGAWVVLSPTAVDFSPGRVVEILHGHYRDWFSDCVQPETVPGRYLSFGLIRPYKQIGSLIAAFVELDDPATSLRLVGELSDPAVERQIAELGVSEPRISVHFQFVTDEQLAAELGRAELVVLPYKEFYNSGAALLALSLGRPVLTPRSTASEALQQEFGAGWVLLFDGALRGAHLKHALDEVRSHPERAPRPDLSRRDWAGISAAHAELYRSIAS